MTTTILRDEMNVGREVCRKQNIAEYQQKSSIRLIAQSHKALRASGFSFLLFVVLYTELFSYFIILIQAFEAVRIQ